MKKIAFVLIAILAVSSVAMSQGMAKSGQWGVQTSIGVATSPLGGTPTIGAKFMASENVAVRVEVGVNSSSTSGGGGSTTLYAVGAGFEYHMDGHGNVSPYVGLQAGYGGGSVPGGGTTPTTLRVVGVFGGEYFFSSNFSWGGEIGVGFVSNSNFGGVSGTTQTTIGTGSATTIFTWYLN